MDNEATKHLVEMYNNWEAPERLSYPPRAEVRTVDFVESPDTFQEIFANPNVEVTMADLKNQ